MAAEDPLTGGAASAVTTIDRQELERLLATAEVLRTVDTGMAGSIRLLSHEGTLLIQEQSQQGTIYLRRVASQEEADRFIADRLATYDRMWDGCGCKVDYET